MKKNLEDYCFNLGFKSLENIQFSDFLLYLESEKENNNLKLITDFLHYVRNNNNFKFKKQALVMDSILTNEQSRKERIRYITKDQIKSKWDNLYKKLKSNGYCFEDIQVLDLIRLIYELFIASDYNISLEKIYKHLQEQNNEQWKSLNYQSLLVIISELFELKKINQSLLINYLYLERYILINKETIMKKITLLRKINYVNDLDVYAFYKRYEKLDLLELLLLNNDGVTYTEIGLKYNISSTQARIKAYEGLQYLVWYLESDKGLYSLQNLLINKYMEVNDLKKIYPRYYKIIAKSLTIKCFYVHYRFIYDKIYNAFYCNKYLINDCKIINQYSKIIDESEYQTLCIKIAKYFMKHGILISNTSINKRLRKIFIKIKGQPIYQRGYAGEKARVMFLLTHNYLLNEDEYKKVFRKNCNKRYLTSK